MAIASVKKRERIVVAGSAHPHYREVLETYVSGRHLEVTELALPEATSLLMSVNSIKAGLSDHVACVLIQYPAFTAESRRAGNRGPVHEAGAPPSSRRAGPPASSLHRARWGPFRGLPRQSLGVGPGASAALTPRLARHTQEFRPSQMPGRWPGIAHPLQKKKPLSQNRLLISRPSARFWGARNSCACRASWDVRAGEAPGPPPSDCPRLSQSAPSSRPVE